MSVVAEQVRSSLQLPVMQASIGGQGESADPLAALAEASRAAPAVGNLEEVDDDSPANQSSTASAPTVSPPSAPVSSQGADSVTSSANNGDASSQEWERVSQHEEEKKTEDVASDAALNQVGQDAPSQAAKEGEESG